jgi:hypothetical protein
MSPLRASNPPPPFPTPLTLTPVAPQPEPDRRRGRDCACRQPSGPHSPEDSGPRVSVPHSSCEGEDRPERGWGWAGRGASRGFKASWSRMRPPRAAGTVGVQCRVLCLLKGRAFFGVRTKQCDTLSFHMGEVWDSLTLGPRAAISTVRTRSAKLAKPTCGRPSLGSANCTYEPSWRRRWRSHSGYHGYLRWRSRDCCRWHGTSASAAIVAPLPSMSQAAAAAGRRRRKLGMGPGWGGAGERRRWLGCPLPPLPSWRRYHPCRRRRPRPDGVGASWGRGPGGVALANGDGGLAGSYGGS